MKFEAMLDKWIIMFSIITNVVMILCVKVFAITIKIKIVMIIDMYW